MIGISVSLFQMTQVFFVPFKLAKSFTFNFDLKLIILILFLMTYVYIYGCMHVYVISY